MTNYYFPIIYIILLIGVDGQASPRLFIAPEIRHEKISYSPQFMIAITTRNANRPYQITDPVY